MGNKIIGLGNALVDVLIGLETDEPLYELGFNRGSMNLVGRDKHEEISVLTEGLEYSYVSGGSAANTIRGLASLGVDTGYIGKIGQDNVGMHIENELTEYGVEVRLRKSDSPTGQCMVLISPDGERTMATFLGAAVEMDSCDITDCLFDGFDILHIEGYLIQNKELIIESVKKAKECGLKISMDMASYNIVVDNKEFINDLIVNYVDIVFANEDEAIAFTGMEPEKSLELIASICEIAIVKLGREGAMIRSGERIIKVPAADPDADVIDTTGAGDLFATGFLFGLTRKYDLETCGIIGSLIAGKVIGNVGPRINSEQWIELKEVLSVNNLL
ncbi:MAG: adenosine kinase [Rikenellaceae bacterium]|nr:adenosine kinase [Rikenellaceae bacterium]